MQRISTAVCGLLCRWRFSEAYLRFCLSGVRSGFRGIPRPRSWQGEDYLRELVVILSPASSGTPSFRASGLGLTGSTFLGCGFGANSIGDVILARRYRPCQFVHREPSFPSLLVLCFSEFPVGNLPICEPSLNLSRLDCPVAVRKGQWSGPDLIFISDCHCC
jgi:hypothetical protein